jgi:hypothetical protein
MNKNKNQNMVNYRSRSANDVYSSMSRPSVNPNNYSSQYTVNDRELNDLNYQLSLNPYQFIGLQ